MFSPVAVCGFVEDAVCGFFVEDVQQYDVCMLCATKRQVSDIS